MSQKKLQGRLARFKKNLDEEEAYAGTGHKRVVIPKSKLTAGDLGSLGFEKVLISVPETGQDMFSSYRHKDNNLHLHSHPEAWTMHEDDHAAATMIAKKRKTTKGKLKAFAEGAPHVVMEGVPGAAYYIKGLLTGAGSTKDRVWAELSPKYKRNVSRLKDSSSYKKEAALMSAKKDNLINQFRGLLKKEAKITSKQGFYKGKPANPDTVKFTRDFQGIPIRVDRPRGFVMTGVNSKGEPWKRRYKHDYGYIPRTLGGDGDGLDVFLGPDRGAKHAYWAVQRKPNGVFDEYKVFLGFSNREEAIGTYKRHIPANMLSGLITMKVEMMKAMLGKEPKERLQKVAAVKNLPEGIIHED